MAKTFNFRIYIGLYLLMFLLFFVIILFYERIHKNGLDLGLMGNSIVEVLAKGFHFPLNIIFKPLSDGLLLFNLMINIAIHTFLLYYILKFILRIIKNRT